MAQESQYWEWPDRSRITSQDDLVLNYKPALNSLLPLNSQHANGMEVAHSGNAMPQLGQFADFCKGGLLASPES